MQILKAKRDVFLHRCSIVIVHNWLFDNNIPGIFDSMHLTTVIKIKGKENKTIRVKIIYKTKWKLHQS